MTGEPSRKWDPKILFVGLACALSYWVLEAMMDRFLFDQGPFLRRLVAPDTRELWMRGSVLVLLAVTWTMVHAYALERRRAEEVARMALAEKEVLLREIHHRVKNNLQIVSTLLDLQSRSIRDPADLQLFKESRNRVRAMALIHEKLYGSGNLANIDFNAYVQSLTNHLFDAYGIDAKKVKIEIDVERVPLDIEKSVTCGLIISELVSNSLKYAFREREGGAVRISVRALPGGAIELSVGDTGPGLPEELDFRETATLGLHLVTILARQLRGTVEMPGGPGTHFAVTFNP